MFVTTCPSSRRKSGDESLDDDDGQGRQQDEEANEQRRVAGLRGLQVVVHGALPIKREKDVLSHRQKSSKLKRAAALVGEVSHAVVQVRWRRATMNKHNLLQHSGHDASPSHFMLNHCQDVQDDAS